MRNADSRRLKVLNDLFAAFNRHDAEGVMAFFHPGIVFDTIAGPEPMGRRIEGPAAVRAAFATTWSVMPDAAWHIHRHAVFGNRAISEWRFTASVSPHSRIDADGVDLFIFSDDLIIGKSAYRKDRPLQAAG